MIRRAQIRWHVGRLNVVAWQPGFQKQPVIDGTAAITNNPNIV